MTLPDIGFDYNELFAMLDAPVKSKLLQTAIEYKLFDVLTRPLSASEIAEALGSQPTNTELFLDALAACKLICKQNGVYQNTQETEALLVSGKPAYMGAWFASQLQFLNETLNTLPQLVKNGPPEKTPEEDMNSAEACEAFTESHARWQLAGYANRVAERCSRLPGFSGFEHMLDLGGGPGILTIALLSTNLNLTGTVFDRQGVTRIAQQYVERYGMTERVSFLNDDYFTDSLGGNYDLIVASDTLYYPGPQLEALVENIFNALKAGGVFVGIHASLTEERTQPENLAIGMLMESLLNRGTLPDAGFLHPILKRAGFADIESDELAVPSGGVFEVTIGWKSPS